MNKKPRKYFWMSESEWKSILSTMAGSKGDDLWAIQEQLLDDRNNLINEIKRLNYICINIAKIVSS